MIVELPAFHEETRKSITLERCVTVVQVFCNGWKTKASIVFRQIIAQPQQYGAVTGTAQISISLND